MESTGIADYRIDYPMWYDARGEWEVESKGWLQGVVVELASGFRYPLFFYDPVRLAQDLEGVDGRPALCIAEPGLVVVPAVTRDAIERAVGELVRRRYFDSLGPAHSESRNGVHSA